MQSFDQRFSGYPPQPAPPYAGAFPPPTQTSTPWANGLCHSFNCSLCCMTCWLPCVTFGRIAEIVDGGSSSCMTQALLYAMIDHITCCVCVYSGTYRGKIRQKYGLEGSACNDYCAHFCCHKCALRQEYLELEHRGFDLSLGWDGNIRRRNREAQLAQAAPTKQAGMHR